MTVGAVCGGTDRRYNGHAVRENVKFQGGRFSQWVHETFPASGCAVAIDFKEFFMDEWTDHADHVLVGAVGDALRSTVPGVLEELEHL